MSFFSKSGQVDSTPFSEFIRDASSRKKKKVYKDVLKKATERQNRLLRKKAADK